MAPLPEGVQPVQTNRGQEYGAAKQQAEAQAAQPIAGMPGVPNTSQLPGGRPGTTPERMPVGPQPGELPRLGDPSGRPNEPITAGMPLGPGPGTDALTAYAFGPEELSVLRGVYLQHPNEDLRRLIEWTESNLA